ncbi:unnamed protein product [Bursaphelenchus xylophilus]|uniref:(pine wood nematode) hypothetical protein n=1 Tax=Bursaphelenchus xylophilus TaxID=6326 RepID=A0A1I7SUV9_BURXY|nr:unnamed protein product [Bursaphelenchus xylophilus]CAG9125827.1 unnamed protein product [Bursaphelenchus xylophilus]
MLAAVILLSISPLVFPSPVSQVNILPLGDVKLEPAHRKLPVFNKTLKAIAPYTDAFARHKMFPLAAAAYSDNPQECLDNNLSKAKVLGMVFAKCETDEKVSMCVGYVAVSPLDKSIIVSFRGTNSFLQLVVEVNHVVLKRKHEAAIDGTVGAYFYNVFEQLWTTGLNKIVSKAVKQYPEYEFWITGHSLGGAVASIAATEIMAQFDVPQERLKVITFGQPRTGDNEYANYYPNAVPLAYRVNHNLDLVAHIPPQKFEDYFHHGSEVWYANKMEKEDSPFKVCDEGESNKCSNKMMFPISINDHLHYFNEYVSTFGVNGCKWSK